MAVVAYVAIWMAEKLARIADNWCRARLNSQVARLWFGSGVVSLDLPPIHGTGNAWLPT